MARILSEDLMQSPIGRQYVEFLVDQIAKNLQSKGFNDEQIIRTSIQAKYRIAYYATHVEISVYIDNGQTYRITGLIDLDR